MCHLSSPLSLSADHSAVRRGPSMLRTHGVSLQNAFLTFFLCLEFKVWPLWVEFNQVISQIPQCGNKSGTGKAYCFYPKKVEMLYSLNIMQQNEMRWGTGKKVKKRLKNCLRPCDIAQVLAFLWCLHSRISPMSLNPQLQSFTAAFTTLNEIHFLIGQLWK